MFNTSISLTIIALPWSLVKKPFKPKTAMSFGLVRGYLLVTIATSYSPRVLTSLCKCPKVISDNSSLLKGFLVPTFFEPLIKGNSEISNTF